MNKKIVVALLYLASISCANAVTYTVNLDVDLNAVVTGNEFKIDTTSFSPVGINSGDSIVFNMNFINNQRLGIQGTTGASFDFLRAHVESSTPLTSGRFGIRVNPTLNFLDPQGPTPYSTLAGLSTSTNSAVYIGGTGFVRLDSMADSDFSIAGLSVQMDLSSYFGSAGSGITRSLPATMDLFSLSFNTLNLSVIDPALPPAEVPEPSTYLLFVLGIVSLVCYRRKVKSA